MRAAARLFVLLVPFAIAACNGDTEPPVMNPDDGPVADTGRDGGRDPGTACTPDCSGRQCGDDGCGGTCGGCADDQVCNPKVGRCVGGCTPDCLDRSCGDNGCGGSCGSCDDGHECAEGRCVAKASCSDGQQNGAETDADCGGGKCPKCLVGKGCASFLDCMSGLCTDDVCAPDLSCQDHQIGGDETDVDCGGTKCDPCPVTKFCKRHEDCLSVACIYGVCREPTCEDDAKNQGEADVDCGGPCTKCADGRACRTGADCVNGGCLDDTCCTPNACGVCGVLPAEVCDGVDNDCNGSTDEASAIGAGQACPKQQGVCKNSKAKCSGAAGWTCDDAAYKAFNSAYEPAESKCDAKDNDCDGSTDEGLTNACGTCGPTPSELCNRVDDDCNGQTDDDARCASCPTAANPVTPVNLDSTPSSWGFTLSWSQYAAMLGDEMFVLAYNRGGGSGPALYRCAEGVYGQAFFPGVWSYDVSAIASGGGFLHVAAEGRPSGCPSTDCMVYQRYDRDAGMLENVTLGPSVFSGDGHAAVAWGGGKTGVMYNHESFGAGLFLRASDGTWSEAGWPANWEYGTHAVIRSDGKAFAISRSYAYDPSTITVVELTTDGGADSWELDTLAERPVMRVAPDDALHVVYAKSGAVYHQRLKKGASTWTGPTQVAYGSDAGIGFDPQGQPVVAYVQNGTDIGIAVQSGTEFAGATVHTSTIDTEKLYAPEVGVDGAGRVHVAYQGVTGSVYADTQYLHYLMACPALGVPVCTPDCSGKACGDNGCGGQCGSCSDGQSCSNGQCVGGPGCGVDPGNTCSGRCGKFTSGASCQCNAACVNYGDCCPDLAACCG